jgi:D-glycero-D-manno-heptose 1,7-bisphosphate phosphatase
MRKLIILDRDGVINEDSDHYIKSPEEWTPIPGSLQAIARLNRAGYEVVVATNQSGLGRGLFSYDTLHAIHNKMHTQLAAAGGHVSAVFFCPHTPDDHCQCRKPRTGMFQEIAARHGRERLDGVPIIGDSLHDLEAGIALGCEPWLVLSGKGIRTFHKHGAANSAKPLPALTRVRASLAAVAREFN